MTNTTVTTELAIVPTDSRGRVRVPPEQREAILDAYEQSGMTGAAFARAHGIKYPTFANWRQKRKQGRSLPVSRNEVPLFEEVGVQEVPQAGLAVELPGGARMTIDRAEQFPLAAALLRHLEQA